jgi:hypothetical protein
VFTLVIHRHFVLYDFPQSALFYNREIEISLCRHTTAFLCTPSASISALLAMLVFVFSTFLAASITNVSAQTADFISESIALGHKAGRRAAYFSAIHIQFYALRHHLHILLLQASGCTMIAKSGAL